MKVVSPGGSHCERVMELIDLQIPPNVVDKRRTHPATSGDSSCSPYSGTRAALHHTGSGTRWRRVGVTLGLHLLIAMWPCKHPMIFNVGSSSTTLTQHYTTSLVCCVGGGGVGLGSTKNSLVISLLGCLIGASHAIDLTFQIFSNIIPLAQLKKTLQFQL